MPDPAGDIYDVGPAVDEEQEWSVASLKGQGVDHDMPGNWGVWGLEDWVFGDFDEEQRAYIEEEIEAQGLVGHAAEAARRTAHEDLTMLKRAIDWRRKFEISRAENIAMRIHHDQMERACNRYAVALRHAEHLEAMSEDDRFHGRVHQMPLYARALFQFEREFDTWNDETLRRLLSNEGLSSEDSLRQEALDEYEDVFDQFAAKQDDPAQSGGVDPLDEFIANILPGAHESDADNYLAELLSAGADGAETEKLDRDLAQLLGEDLMGEAEGELEGMRPGEKLGMDPLDVELL